MLTLSGISNPKQPENRAGSRFLCAAQSVMETFG
jgi:hypothetical protein